MHSPGSPHPSLSKYLCFLLLFADHREMVLAPDADPCSSLRGPGAWLMGRRLPSSACPPLPSEVPHRA